MAAGGRIDGPSARGEFMRTDFAPRIAAPSSHFLPTATPAFLSAASESARLLGALFEMCCTVVPAAAAFAASFSSHLRPDGDAGSNCEPSYMVSSVTSPNRPEKMSICVTPGNVSFVNCGKSSIVISPYFCFSSAFSAFPRPPPCCRVLKMYRIGHEHDAIRSSLSFSVQCCAAAPSGTPASATPAAAIPAPAVLKKSRRSMNRYCPRERLVVNGKRPVDHCFCSALQSRGRSLVPVTVPLIVVAEVSVPEKRAVLGPPGSCTVTLSATSFDVMVLFLPQRFDWIDARGPARGQHGGGERRGDQGDHRDRIDTRVPWVQPEQEATSQVREPPCGACADDQSRGHEAAGVAQDAGDHARARRAERHADADLSRLPRDEIGDDTEDADRGDHETQEAEEAEHQHVQPALGGLHGHEVLQACDIPQRHPRQYLRDDASERR